MESLRGTERTWMAKLLTAFNTGELQAVIQVQRYIACPLLFLLVC